MLGCCRAFSISTSSLKRWRSALFRRWVCYDMNTWTFPFIRSSVNSEIRVPMRRLWHSFAVKDAEPSYTNRSADRTTYTSHIAAEHDGKPAPNTHMPSVRWVSGFVSDDFGVFLVFLVHTHKSTAVASVCPLNRHQITPRNTIQIKLHIKKNSWKSKNMKVKQITLKN